MTVALSVLLSGFNDFVEAVAVESAADTGSDASKIVDSALSIYGDGYFIGWWVYMTSGSAVGDIRQIEGFAQGTTTLTPYVNFSAAVANNDTYELHKHNPDTVRRAINDAIDSLYTNQRLYRKIVFEGLGTSLLGSDAASAQADVEVVDATLFFAEQILTIEDDNASETCTILSINTTTKVLTMTANLTNAYATADNAKVTAQSGKYFSLGAILGNARITGVFIKLDETARRARETSWEIVTNDDGVRQLYFPTSISVDDKTWVIEAIAKLEEVSDPTDTITLEDERVKLLYAEAAYHFYERQGNEISAGDWERLKALATSYRQKALIDFKSMCMPKIVEIADFSTYED